MENLINNSDVINRPVINLRLKADITQTFSAYTWKTNINAKPLSKLFEQHPIDN